MTNRRGPFLLTEETRPRWFRDFVLQHCCPRCRKLLKYGDEIAVKVKRKTEYYHKICWEELLL